MIAEFRGPYAWLSNFYAAAVVMDGKLYPSVEHAFAAAKTESPDSREWVRTASSPAEAKRRGRQVPLRAGWNEMRVEVMRGLLKEKFAPGTILATWLVATGDEELVEGNYWQDRFWGQCPLGVGENWLGKLLMERRKELKDAA